MPTFLKPQHFDQALAKACPTPVTKYPEFHDKDGANDGYNAYRQQVLNHLQSTDLTFLKQDFIADMQSSTDVDKWLGHSSRSTAATVMCVSNALSELKVKHKDPSPNGEKFTWEIDYIVQQVFGTGKRINTGKLLGKGEAITEVKSSPGTYLVVLFMRKDFAAPGQPHPKDPKKSVEAGGISHMQVWKMPDKGDRFEIVDPQSNKEAWLKSDVKLIVWKIA